MVRPPPREILGKHGSLQKPVTFCRSSVSSCCPRTVRDPPTGVHGDRKANVVQQNWLSQLSTPWPSEDVVLQVKQTELGLLMGWRTGRHTPSAPSKQGTTVKAKCLMGLWLFHSLEEAQASSMVAETFRGLRCLLYHTKNGCPFPLLRQRVRPRLEKVRQSLHKLKAQLCHLPLWTLCMWHHLSMPPCLIYKVRMLILMILVTVNSVSTELGYRVPRYLVIYYSGCLCESVFGGDEHLNQ